MSRQMADTASLKEAARSWGASLVGIADLERLAGIETEPSDLLAGYRRAVSIAVRLADGVVDPIDDRPTPLYQKHYDAVNVLLDDIAIRVGLAIQAAGGRALPLPASQVLDRERLTSYLSHKAVAVAAGIGWQGKSLLTVSPEYGPRIRLVSVLTDLDYQPDEPLRNRCGSCSACAEACPAGAIKDVPTDSHYASRDEAIHLDRCRRQVTEIFPRLPHITSSICGVCVAACPWGRRGARGSGKR